jgi:hypothetical protein
MAEWVLAVERAYVSAATSKRRVTVAEDEAQRPRGAVASHYLAVGTPRSFGLVVDATTLEAGALSLAAHRAWFAPIDLRCAGGDIAGMRATSVAEALACDIVCIHVPIAIPNWSVRRGTHLNVLTAMELPEELSKLAAISRETPGLGELAAGFVDGRQLDEITIFVAGDASIALAALAALA